MKKIVLTGGGTAGHVTPNIALLPSLKEAGYEVFYIGSYTGIEKTLIEDLGIPYYGISSGKLRRYRSLKNLVAAACISRKRNKKIRLLESKQFAYGIGTSTRDNDRTDCEKVAHLLAYVLELDIAGSSIE
jgi:UDP-N-acetylglucosamine:LPS N-acetylglucosamine transferase